MRKKLVLIGGPTGVGKTKLAIEIAKLFNGEIISCDSVAIYKQLDIGSAKPTILEQQQANHHLIDILEPFETYSVAEYKKDAENVIENIYKNNKLPIVVGGTGLYMKGLLFPLELGNSDKDEVLRAKYHKLAEEKGGKYLLDYLGSFDPESAQKLHEKDITRIIRAIEIYELTGIKKSSIKTELNSEYDYFLIFLNDNRKELYNRINNRVEEMFNLGLETEVKNLIQNYNLTNSNQSMSAIGYKEFFDYFDNKISKSELIEKIKLNSRHYAKRQITWFKSMPKVKEYNCKNTSQILEDIKKFLND